MGFPAANCLPTFGLRLFHPGNNIRRANSGFRLKLLLQATPVDCVITTDRHNDRVGAQEFRDDHPDEIPAEKRYTPIVHAENQGPITVAIGRDDCVNLAGRVDELLDCAELDGINVFRINRYELLTAASRNHFRAELTEDFNKDVASDSRVLIDEQPFPAQRFAGKEICVAPDVCAPRRIDLGDQFLGAGLELAALIEK